MFKRFSAGFALGYVVGTRAGEKRYKQISDLANKALDIPAVSRLSDRASELFTAENGRHLLDVIKERATGGPSQEDDEDEDDFEDDSDERLEDDSDERFEDDEDEGDFEDEGDIEDDSGVDDLEEDSEVDASGPRGRDDDDEQEPRRHRQPRRAGNKGRRGRQSRHEERDGRRNGSGIRGLATAALERGRVT